MSLRKMDSAMTDISVIVATFRRPGPLKEALTSALAQTGVDIEVLVVDDCPDASAESAVAELGDSRIHYWSNPAPTGGNPGIVRNLAWPRARGRFVHFLDDDDLVPEGAYRDVVAAFDRAPEAGVIFGRVAPFGDNAAEVQAEEVYFATARRRAAAARRFGRRWGFAANMVFDSTLLVCSAAVIRRECIAPLGGFDPSVRVVEDVDFFGRAMRRFGAEFIDRTTLHRRVGPSIMHQPDVQPLVSNSYRTMQDKYRAEWGSADFYALKSFARTVLRVM